MRGESEALQDARELRANPTANIKANADQFSGCPMLDAVFQGSTSAPQHRSA
jgi:hypothetical protein